MGEREFGIDPEMVGMRRRGGQDRARMGVQVCLVIGGGNIFRGVVGARPRAWSAPAADYMGMLATVINALAMQSALERHGRADPCAVGHPDGHGLRALYPPPRHPPHGEGPGGDLRRRHRQSVLHHRHRRGAARRRDGLRRAAEGHPGRRRLHRRSARRTRTPSATRRSAIMEVLSQDLQVMDASAISLARENRIPIVVFSIHKPGALRRGADGRGHATPSSTDERLRA